MTEVTHPEPGRAQAVRLGANQPPQFYRGGAAIAAFRGSAEATTGPEDWVASTTTRFGAARAGLSALPDGRLLRDAVRADPPAWLGPRHLARFGDSTALLVKLLDAGQRLPVHFHPDDPFTSAHFHSPHGKTEAWIVAGTRGDRGQVHVGFRRDVDLPTVRGWVEAQDAVAMLDALHTLEVAEGDVVHIPAGLPHAIGEGVFVVELQQPTDFSLTLEWQGFLAGPEQAHLGIGYDAALLALDRSGWDAGRLASLVRRADTVAADRPSVSLLPPAANGFFRAHRLRGGAALEASLAVVVVLGGSGTLRCADATALPVRRGDTVLVPYAAGGCVLEGADVVAVACRPPA